MHRTYQIITDATADMVPEMLVGLPEVQVIPMGVTLGEKAYTYGPGGDITVEEFYDERRDGKFATTSQINPTVYLEYFEACLQKGGGCTLPLPHLRRFGDLPDSLALCSGTPGKVPPKAR